MSAQSTSYDSGAKSTQISAVEIRSPYAGAHTDDIDVLVTTDVESPDVHSRDTTDVEPDHVGPAVGITESGDPAVAAEGDGSLSPGEALKDRHSSIIGPQWGDGRTTWHPRDVVSSPTDHSSPAALAALNTERRKQEVQRLFGPDSWLKRSNDGTASNEEGNRHEADVQLRITAFCEQLEFQAHENEVVDVYKQLPSEPFQPIGGHESADCSQLESYPAWVISDVHPPENGDFHYGWDVEYTKMRHNATTCPSCDQCRCGNYHLGEPPKNGVETKILAAMLLVDQQRIQAAEDMEAAFDNRLQARDGYTALVTHHALDPMQALQTARKHYDSKRK